MKSKADIEKMISDRLQETYGMTDEIPLDPTLLGDNEPTREEIEQADIYAWNMFPSGGWAWVIAFYDYIVDEISKRSQDGQS